MKKLFTRFWRRNLAFGRLAILSNLEYRLNFFTDALMQPSLAALIEVTLWFSIFKSSARAEINGFGINDYLAYVLWATFVARITSNWMYEFRMVEEIESGSINGLLVRPMSFFEYYLSQFMGYKLITTLVSFVVPIVALWIFDLPTQWSRLPIALILVFYHLIFVQSISFIISTLGFQMTKIHSITVAKNLGLWLLSGELVPIDLLPEPWRSHVMDLPFANAVYIPVGYITGRIPFETLQHGFFTNTCGLIVTSFLGWVMWRAGIRKYVGTGA